MRGMGCAACHIPYSNEGFYEGTDPAIPKDKKGHPHKKSFHDQLMERTWAPGMTFHSIYETKKPQIP